MLLFEDIRSWWRARKNTRAEEAMLSKLPRAEIDTSKLGKIDKGEIERILTEPKLHEEWLAVAKEIDRLILIEDMKTGGVNPGDRRALYYLVRALGLKRVLEIGTHVGASTIHIAAAMKANLLADETPNEYSLVTAPTMARPMFRNMPSSRLLTILPPRRPAISPRRIQPRIGMLIVGKRF